MQKREMTMKEQNRETVMKELVAGFINGTEAAVKIGVSVRQVKRLKQVYEEEGSEGLVHHSRGRRGSRKTAEGVEQKVIRSIKDTYHDFGPTLAAEKLRGEHKVKLCTETIRQIMIGANLWKERKRRTKQDYHQWRERKAGYGEMQQFDGSYHDWFEGRNPAILEACLLASIDDATGKITGAAFAANEGVEAVFDFWKIYILVNGKPVVIYLDKFSTYKINHRSAVDNHDLMTQFQRAAKQLTIRLIPAHSPQAKGRIERLFQTLQDRLVKEMRLHNISTIAEANIFLRDTFIPWFNTQFSVSPRSPVDMHTRITTDLQKGLNSIFSVHSSRLINDDFTIRFKNKWYQLQEVQPTTVYKTDTVTIEEWLDTTVHITCKGEQLNYLLLPERPAKQKTQPLILTTHKLNWKPASNHPWRSYINS